MMAINRFLQQQQATLQSLGLSEVLERVLAIINRMYRIYTIFLSLLTYLGTHEKWEQTMNKNVRKNWVGQTIYRKRETLGGWLSIVR